MQAMSWGSLAWHWGIAIAVRLTLLLMGVGEALLWRPEVSTPANTLLKAREGIRLLQLGISPYQGSSCHLPPLWLAVMAPWVQHKVLCVLPNMVCDVVAAATLLLASRHLFAWPAGPATAKRDAPWLSPQQLSLLYLLNPFAVLASVSGTSTSAENMGVMLAVAGGLMRNAPMAAAGVAVGAYMGLHPALLVVPLLLLMWRGPEDILRHVPGPQAPVVLPSKKVHGSGGQGLWHSCIRLLGVGASQQHTAADGAQAAASTKAAAQNRPAEGQPNGSSPQCMQKAAKPAAETAAAAAAAAHGQQNGEKQHEKPAGNAASASAAAPQNSSALCLLFCVALVLYVSALVVLSDAMMQQHPKAQCLPALVQWAQRQAGLAQAQQQQQLSSCWAVRVYRLSLLLEDYTPNIGLWWYFFTEMFDAFRPFFLFVFHSFSVMLAVPVALRFANRPLFVAWVQLFISCMFKPYACVGDMVPWMALLPLLQQQLQCVKAGLFFINSFVLLLVLGPAMWHQWINVDAANSNFFYSITLLLGVWNTVFLAHIARLTVLLDRRLACKRLELDVDELVDAGGDAGAEGAAAAKAKDA